MSKSALHLDDLVQYVTLHIQLPSLLNGSTIPFFGVYALLCVVILMYQEYHEIGLISMAVFGFIQILVCLCCFWSVHINTFLNYKKTKSPAKGVIAKVVPTPNNGKSELVRVQATRFGDHGKLVHWFMFQKIKYVWDEEKATFRGIEFPINRSLHAYYESKGLENEDELSVAEKTYGVNKMEMVIPEFAELFIERATAPFFVFQIFSVSLWCLEEYWYYSLFTLFMLILFECTLVQQQLRNMNEIRKMGNKPHQTQVYRNRKWRPINTDQLVPGDIISMSRSKDDSLVPCDVVMLRGTCIVDESMLTGESVPQMKESLENCNWDMEQELDPEGDGKLFCLFGGTKIIQTTAPAKGSMRAPDNGCIGYVLRNGFNTSQGKLLRTILFGVKRVTENNLETFAFILFLMIFAIAAASYVWVKGTLDPERNRYKLFLECTLILTSIIPPDLPIELSLAVNTSLLQLSKLFVFCTEPFRIPFAGKIQICCFDKTGTLTSDNLMVEGVAGLKPDKSITSVDELPETTVQVLACCHSLAQLDDGLVGDPLEKATLLSIDWNVTKLDAVVPKKGKFKPLRIVQRYHFSSALKRMSVLASYQVAYSNETGYIGAVKGAPEVIRTMLKEVPSWYEDTYLEYSRRGARVLALARKEFGPLDHAQVREIKRETLESGLTFEGFVVISCPLKTDSKAAIKEIVQASHKVVMITGDNPLTACHVAKELRFTRKPVLVLTKDRVDDEKTLWHWKSIKGDLRQPMDAKQTKQLVEQYDLCMTGESLHYLRDEGHEYMLKVLPHIAVYARFAPKQKEFVITTLKHLGYYTLMCGDGTNDVGALKHANVGVSILSSPPPQKLEKKKEATALIDTVAATPVVPAAKTPVYRADESFRGQVKTMVRDRLAQHNEEMSGIRAKMQKRLKDMEELKELQEMQMVKLGDASIAAPFTSRLSSIQCVCHIIKQGRCTLVTTLQMFKILALNSLISAYSQSVLYVDGVKLSDTQATLQGLLLAASFLFITRSKPLKVLSKRRPLPNIFNFYTITTILSQFAVHFAALVYLVNEAKVRSPQAEGKIVLNMDIPVTDEEVDFEPTLIRSTVYIMSMALQVSTIAVNYKGHPFMESLRENKCLFYSVVISAMVVICLALNVSPQLTAAFQIVDMQDEFRHILVIVLVADAVLAFGVDRLCSFLFGERRLKFQLANNNS